MMLINLSNQTTVHAAPKQNRKLGSSSKQDYLNPNQIQLSRIYKIQVQSNYIKKITTARLKPTILYNRAVESEVPSSDSDSRQFRLSDSDSNSDSGPTPTFSCISYLK